MHLPRKLQHVHKPKHPKEITKRAVYIFARIAVTVYIIHLGVIGLEQWHIFIRMGRTGEYVFGSIFDRMLLGWWDKED